MAWKGMPKAGDPMMGVGPPLGTYLGYVDGVGDPGCAVVNGDRVHWDLLPLFRTQGLVVSVHSSRRGHGRRRGHGSGCRGRLSLGTSGEGVPPGLSLYAQGVSLWVGG